MYSNILVCFDDSEGSKQALKKASDLCLANDQCQLTVLQVVSDKGVVPPNQVRAGYSAVPRMDNIGYYATDLKAPPIENTFNEDINELQDVTIDHAKELLETKGIHATYETLEGNAAHKICEYAEQQQVDLIIVGNSGKSGLKKLFMGSVSEHVAKNAEIDILIVK